MKKPTKSVFLIVAGVYFIGAIIVVSLVAPRFFSESREYGEAEPLVQVIWPMADEMKRFAEERGHPPKSLDEIAGFSPDHDFSALRGYPHEFSTSGPRRFFLRVNKRIAFIVDENYNPAWYQDASAKKPENNLK